MATTARSQRPTPAQKSLLLDMVRTYNRTGNPLWSRTVGSPSTCEHLVRKGYLDVETLTGPRGGRTYRYTPTQAALDLVEKHDRPFRNAAAKVDEYFLRHHGTEHASRKATVQGWAPLPEHLHGKGYGNDFVTLNPSDVFTPAGLRNTFGRGFTTIAVTAPSEWHGVRVTADFSIGELMRADDGEA